MVRIELLLKPKLGASTLCLSRKSRDLEEVFVISFQSKISRATVLVPSMAGIEKRGAGTQIFALDHVAADSD